MHVLSSFAAVTDRLNHLPKHTAISSFEKNQGRSAKKLYKMIISLRYTWISEVLGPISSFDRVGHERKWPLTGLKKYTDQVPFSQCLSSEIENFWNCSLPSKKLFCSWIASASSNNCRNHEFFKIYFNC